MVVNGFIMGISKVLGATLALADNKKHREFHQQVTRELYSYGHLPVISGYKWDYAFYKWGYKYL
jgi:hypothetical protein